jgi:hypothetical protein
MRFDVKARMNISASAYTLALYSAAHWNGVYEHLNGALSHGCKWSVLFAILHFDSPVKFKAFLVGIHP